jgi:hypothetical protein
MKLQIIGLEIEGISQTRWDTKCFYPPGYNCQLVCLGIPRHHLQTMQPTPHHRSERFIDC